MGLVMHVIDHTVQIRDLTIDDEQRDRLCEDVFTILHHDSLRLLCEFDAQCSLATYMTIIARRIIVRLLLNRNVNTTTTTRKAA